VQRRGHQKVGITLPVEQFPLLGRDAVKAIPVDPNAADTQQPLV